MNLFSSARRAPGECIVSIDGDEIADLYAFLKEVSVDTSRSAAFEGRLSFETRRDLDGAWIVQDDPRIQPWRSVTIEAAFGNETEEVMRGYIREVRVQFPEDTGGAEVTVVVQDSSLLLDREHKRRAWGVDAPTSDGVIAATIIAEHNLAAEAAPGAGHANLVLNQDETDIRFLKRRAVANGYELLFRDGQVYFGPWRLTGEPQAAILVYAGSSTNCVNLSVNDDGHRPDRVTYEVAAAAGATTETETVAPDLELLGPQAASSADIIDDRFAWRLSREGVSNAEHARLRAQQQANSQSMKVRASGSLDGTVYGHVLKVGLTVVLDGVGNRHAGTWYVDKATHRFDVNGYRTDFELLRNAYGDNVAASANPLAALL